MNKGSMITIGRTRAYRKLTEAEHGSMVNSRKNRFAISGERRCYFGTVINGR